MDEVLSQMAMEAEAYQLLSNGLSPIMIWSMAFTSAMRTVSVCPLPFREDTKSSLYPPGQTQPDMMEETTLKPGEAITIAL